MMEKNYVVVDIETTGFSPLKGNRIIEVGAVRVRDGVIVDRLSQLIDPELPIPEHITRITGINDSMVQGMPTADVVIPRLYEFIGNDVVVAHNAKFDWGTFLSHYFSQMGLMAFNKVVCTLELSKRYIRSENYKLGTLCSGLGINLNNAHRAVYDAEATAYLMNCIVDRM